MSVSSWEPDPTGRHQYRWFDGQQWTDQVADDGVQSTDPVDRAEAEMPPVPPPSTAPPPTMSPEGSATFAQPSTPNPVLMLATRWRRFGAYLLEGVLALVTLFVGWLIWSLIVYSRGQTPAKQVLKMRVISLENRRAASWGSMFVREWILKTAIPFVLGLLPFLVIAGLLWTLVSAIMVLSTEKRQAIWDKMLKTVVIHDPAELFRPQK
ncbi:RDD family protein [Candidatus Poriferisocius sp.]|uniref:RDD family protein n=1 Tax=Candidatus Poriferisocius sp. TaxID=3101276 RepID=UPI003B5CA29D